MLHSLQIMSGPRAGARFELDGDADIGRGTGCRIRVLGERISRQHARITVDEDDTVWVEDLESRNGTWIGERRVLGRLPLAPGEAVRVGDTALVLDPATDVLPARYTGGVVTLDDAVVPGAADTGEDLRTLGRGLMATLIESLDEAPDEASLLTGALEVVMSALGAERGCLLTPSRNPLRPGVAAVSGATGLCLPTDLAAGVLTELEASRRLHQYPGEDTARSVLTAPIIAGGEVLAALVLERSLEGGGRPWADAATRGLEGAGRVTGLALSRQRRLTTLEMDLGTLLRDGPAGVPAVVGSGPSMRRTLEAAEEAARSGALVRILGEPGTGRELLARFIHASSPRAEQPLVVVDAALAGEALARELLGAESAGGEIVRRGALERAEGGTLVLTGGERVSEADELTLLRALVDGFFVRLGGQRPVPVDVRLVAAMDLKAAGGSRRSPLHTRFQRRLGTLTLRLPPLRDRIEDAPDLFEHFALEAAEAVGALALTLAPDGRAALIADPWPGNVRELRHRVHALASRLPSGHAVTAQDLADVGEAVVPDVPLADQIARLEAERIRAALEASGGKKIHAARRLGISRPTLDRKLERYDIEVSQNPD